ncbi:THAP domain [Popillia japonica]|uniref:THAP domain n=1 Tax=Popillia japonica TaxID=7064 RepID=A0AAW1MG65_POPJA
MQNMGIYCAVSGCVESAESKHRFPNPINYPQLFQRWIVVCGRKELQHRSPENIFNNCRVCRKYFSQENFGRNNVLLKTSIPTRHLPALNRRAESSRAVMAPDSPGAGQSRSRLKARCTIDQLKTENGKSNATTTLVIPSLISQPKSSPRTIIKWERFP